MSHTRVYTFGYSKHGQLGHPPTANAVYPTEVKALDSVFLQLQPQAASPVKSASCGGAYTSLVSTTGEVFSFGDMRGHIPQRELVWKNMPVKKIASSAMFDLALMNNGDVFWWGKMNPSETASFSLPQKLEAPAGFGFWTVKFADLAAGALHALLISSSGDVYAFGSNEHGQLAMDDQKDIEKLTLIPFFYSKSIKAAQVACGGNHSAVLSRDGEVWVFGSNKYGQLGLGDHIDRRIPCSVKKTLPQYTKITSVACGDYHTFTVCGGLLQAFGRNHCGQLGLGDFQDRLLPTQVTALQSYDVLKVASNGGYGCSHTLVLVNVGLGMLYSFGSGALGQLGYRPEADNGQCTPKVVPDFEKKIVVDFACGWMHSVVIVEDPNPVIPQQQPVGAATGPLTFSFINSTPFLGDFSPLPSDLYRLILSHLDAKDLSRLGSVCKFFMLASNDNLLWKALLEKMNYPYNPHNIHWKLRYIQYKGRHLYVTEKGGMVSSILSLLGAPPGVFSKLFPRVKGKVLMVGLDAAGKTTILYKMRLGDILTTIPTIGFNVETVMYKNMSFCCWDIGGPDKIRPLWRHYMQDAKRMVFVVDSNDRQRLDEATHEMMKMLENDEMKNVPLLVFANKQDLPMSMSVAEITDRMGLHSLRRAWYIQACCATSGDGIYEGFDWLLRFDN